MSESEPTLEEHLETHRLLRQKLPNAWNAFFARFGRLRPVQLAAIPPVLAGSNVLVTAPTAGGKTEAVVAPLCEKMVSNRWPGLSVLLITPTRALVNDLYFRLERPCDAMRVSLGRKTADHAISQDLTERLLITTPESTESLLTFKRHTLKDLKAVVIDEIHLLDGSPRGDQLRIILARLSAYLHHAAGDQFGGLQLLAMSATVPDAERLALAYLGRAAQIVSVPGQRDIEAQLLRADGSDADRARAAVAGFERFSEVHKVLVFVNSRRQVDDCVSHYRQGIFENAHVVGHHGSLSKHQRETNEARFKDEDRAVCVATMTLEVGIDIGDVDLVTLIDPPFSLASFLQRIGRGCRRLNGRTRVLCVARDRAGEIIFEAMCRQAGLGLPVGPAKPFRRSVLIQQVLAYLKQVDGNSRTAEQLHRVFVSEALPAITREDVELSVTDLVQQQYIDRRGRVFQPASLGWEFIQSSRIYSNLEQSASEVALFDADTGRLVANVGTVAGTHVRVAGRTYELVPGGHSGQQKVRSVDADAASPRYSSHGLPYAADLGPALAEYLQIPLDSLAVVPVADGVRVMTWLGKLHNLALNDALQTAGLTSAAKAFSLQIRGRSPQEALDLMKTAVTRISTENPFGRIPEVDRTVDLGPYFGLLSEPLQAIARRDWLDAAYLQRWVNGLQSVRPIDGATQLGGDLLQLP